MLRRMLRRNRWRFFTADERLVIRQALEGNRPYIGGETPYGMHYGQAVGVLDALREEIT
jgi:hypothetical protein